jgi:hypothetical protein
MTTTTSKPPQQAIMELISAAWASQASGTIARLRLADHIAQGIDTPASIAERTNASADAVYRLVRAGAMLGIVREVAPKKYALTDVGELYRSDHPRSMRALVDAESAPGHWQPWGRLDEAVRRGGSVATEVLGMDVWSYYAKNGAEGQAFAQGMTGLSMAALGAISEAWTPPAAKHVVDVGGSHGAFLDFVLGRLPEAKGTLYDLPAVIDSAKPRPRVALETGDFFKSVPSGADLYLLKHILHDWDDARCVQVLSNVRAAMAPGATVVIVEMLVPEDGSPSPAILLDLNMLVMLPGRERTATEMTALLATAGLAVQRVVPTHSPFALIEAKAR